jgi:hypothetical protein
VSTDKVKDTPATKPNAAAPAAEKLADLMASAAKAAPAKCDKPTPDLERDALLAAERAISESERALAAARAQLQERAPVAPPKPNRRELALKLLLAANVLAMVVVALLPPAAAPAKSEPTPAPAPVRDDAAQRRFHEPFNNALAAADRGDHAGAITILERYLAESPRMLPSQKLNVLNMLSHYAGLAKDWQKARDYAQKASSLGQSHSLPADLVEMARDALANGDQETLRRVWARFLLQQKQIPSWLYKHVAEAYLQLGDSYRLEANAAAERARAAELAATAARLREEAQPDSATAPAKEKGK